MISGYEKHLSQTSSSISDAQDVDVSPLSGRIFYVNDRTIYYVQTTSREPEVKAYYSSNNRIEKNTLMVDDNAE